MSSDGRISVYFSRPIDWRSPRQVENSFADLRARLPKDVCEVVDPAGIAVNMTEERWYRNLVDAQLVALRSCDFILADLSATDHFYIGCIAELVYAHVAGVRSVVVVGENRLVNRPWLLYHSDHLCISLDQGVDIIRRSIGSEE